MMEKLTKITFSISLIGILLLLFLANQIEPKAINIEGITKSMMNRQVKIIGKIINIRNMEGFQIMMVQDKTGTMTVTADSETPINKTNAEIMIIGKVSEYKGEVQISASKIIELS